MNTKQLTLLNKLSSQFAVNKRLSFVMKVVVNNEIVESIQKAQEDSFIVHIDNKHEFDIDFFNDEEICLTYFFKNDDDYSQYTCTIDSFDDNELNQLIRDITIEQ